MGRRYRRMGERPQQEQRRENRRSVHSYIISYHIDHSIVLYLATCVLFSSLLSARTHSSTDSTFHRTLLLYVPAQYVRIEADWQLR